jgi:hypothetical protein
MLRQGPKQAHLLIKNLISRNIWLKAKRAKRAFLKAV